MRSASPLLTFAFVALASSAPAQVAWVPKKPLTNPPAREGAALAYDSVRGVTMMFGGCASCPSQPEAGTWFWDGTTWAPLTATATPTARSSSALAYDATRDRFVMFGGIDAAGTLLGDTWEFDATTLSWTQRTPTSSPPARRQHAMAFDAQRSRVVLFGGTNSPVDGETLNDTWEWDGTSWIEACSAPACTPPHERRGHGLVYDSFRNVALLFGGYDNSDVSNPNKYYDDLWSWNGSTWTQVLATSPFGGRAGHGFAFDTVRGVAVLFGGQSATASAHGDTWEWDGVQWRQATGLPPQLPAARRYPGLTFDAERAQVVAFGGRSDIQVFNETWEFGTTVASYSLFGAGCPGSNNLVPSLVSSPTYPTPIIGQCFCVEVRNLCVLGQPCACAPFITFVPAPPFNARVPIPQAPGCLLDIPFPIPAVPLANVGGTATFQFLIANDSALVGGQFINQGVILDLCANPLGVITSNSALATIGTQ
jgi:hypothetical protein